MQSETKTRISRQADPGFFFPQIYDDPEIVIVNRHCGCFESRKPSKPQVEIYIIPPMPPMQEVVQAG
jgi:hypothetical protein